jgi:hypothetical protein
MRKLPVSGAKKLAAVEMAAMDDAIAEGKP